MEADQWAAWAAVVQAAAVAPALIVATAALRGERNDRQVDRVLALHQELVAGDLGEVRLRLSERVRREGPGRGEPLRRDELDSSARRDLAHLLSYFERVEAARLAGSVNRELLTELIGRHAAWFDIGIAYDNRKIREALHSLAMAVNEHACAGMDRRVHLSDWGASRRSDFSELTRERYRDLCVLTTPGAARWEWLNGPSKPRVASAYRGDPG
ncbi:hypothetical protein [Hamadaea tsunoensis]|uniref:hypothetical protein n=1 Tax=Hamadaea tsunoensis TaxID=53368 RepID=UPI0012FA42D5|nr:hypothetical protein [Hamadaea tsunoensis]